MPLERMDPANVRWFERGVLKEHVARYEFAQKHVGGHVLDIACGTGYGSAMLAASADSVIGVDISPDAVAAAASRVPGVAFQTGDASALPFEAGTFTHVVSFETIEHLAADRITIAIAEFARVLRDGGRLIISTPERQSFSLDRHSNNPFHTKEFTLDEFTQLLEKHFVIESMSGQKFSRQTSLGIVKKLAAVSSHAVVSKFWRAYKMIICQDTQVVDLVSRSPSLPMILVFVAKKRAPDAIR